MKKIDSFLKQLLAEGHHFLDHSNDNKKEETETIEEENKEEKEELDEVE